jgi:hypothetical protein
MTIDDAVKLWVGRDFSRISTSLIKKAFKDNFEELELLSSEYPELDYPACWGWMFHPECSIDELWIKNNITTVEECGFLVYDSKETGILLGIDNMGYSFFDKHWKPLYKAIGLEWHLIESQSENKKVKLKK